MNTETLFPELNSNARLWIYAVDGVLNPDTKAKVEAHLNQFVAQWHSHGRKVNGHIAVVEDRFILIGADIPDAEISGCGIDASVHALEKLGEALGFALLSGLNVIYRNQDKQITHATRGAFRQMVRDELINGDTIVFDTSITEIGQLRAHAFQLAAKDAWHAMVFRIPAPIS